MTHEQSNFIKNNWINFSTLVVVLGFIIAQSKWQQRVDTHMLEFEKHQDNTTLHMPFEDKIQVFVPRTEIDSRLISIENLLLDLKEEIKRSK